MNLFVDKLKEVSKTLLPVVILVLILSFTIVDINNDIIIRFLLGSILLLFGLTLFLLGVDLAMNPIGEHMSKEVASSKTLLKIALLSFVLGFLITVAEPDLLILGNQIEGASGGTLASMLIVYMVSIGVGVMISLGVFRLLRNRPLNKFMAITYALILVLGYFVSEEFLAIAFDASGATTGALTTPFVLALSMGLSLLTGGESAEENSFGLVGIMSAGPILAVMLLSLISGQRNIQGVAGEYVFAEGIIKPMLDIIPTMFKESFFALLPITLLFLGFNFFKFKINKTQLSRIFKGLAFTLIGLVIFLTAVNSGFMDMGRILGMEIAKLDKRLLIGVGFVLGLIIVLVEPAVHVLGEQIQSVTGGAVPINIIRATLSLGVGIAIALSMVRIVVPEVKLWYFLLPGFALAIILSFFSDSIFVGIAYDAGGVASGPMTATFVLAFAQGAATSIETANVLVDGFGVIAMVAMAPVLAIMILGTIFKHKAVVEDSEPAIVTESTKQVKKTSKTKPAVNIHDFLMVVVNRGSADKVIEVAREAGATGATIFHGRGSSKKQMMLPIVNVTLLPEKEMVYFILDNSISDDVAAKLCSDTTLQKAEIAIYITQTIAKMNNPQLQTK